MKPWLRSAIALLIAFTAAPTAAQQSTTVSPPANAQTQTGADGAQDGIKLHGNWVLDVRNPDGTLVAHSEFKNALTPLGRFALADLLAGWPLRELFVTFNDNDTGDLDLDSLTTTPLCRGNSTCIVAKAAGPLVNRRPADVNVSLFPTLSSASWEGKLVLTGTFTITTSGPGGAIQRVTTHLTVSEISGLETDRALTVATLPTPVPVVQGQIVQFTYTLSFS